MSKTPQPGRQGRTIWDVLPDTARALNEDGGCRCVLLGVLWLIALAIVACTVVTVVQVLRP
jgi:hypothetical protein